ncbi:DSC E3 ubiquitin ligase complex subunit 3 C-terminal domain-containing protein [[Candida] zeylanoides]
MHFTLTVRFTVPPDIQGEVKDLDIPLDVDLSPDESQISVQWIKSTVRDRVPQCGQRRLRLIHGGRVLSEKSDLRREVFEPRVRQQQQAAEGEAETLRVFVHCLIGEVLTPQQLAEENKLDSAPQARTTAPEVVGFDRLLQQGFSPEDIEDLRRQFHAIYNPNEASNAAGRWGGGSAGEISDLEEEEARQRRVRQLEERWIESTVTPAAMSGDASGSLRAPEGGDATVGATGGAAGDIAGGADGGTAPAGGVDLELDENSGNEDLLLGLVVGIFLGVLSVILLALDSSVFNKRQKSAIVAGVFINFSFAVMRGQWV